LSLTRTYLVVEKAAHDLGGDAGPVVCDADADGARRAAVVYFDFDLRRNARRLAGVQGVVDQFLEDHVRELVRGHPRQRR
jgi:hypothetical protein